ncbi:hypothetical protein NDU88_004649 [Pleurodeles waltl]|uniref:Uncharacterized protein n=1 Tax=Pleurodeles waltl TaxID=8319 RepID=A0AAV7PDF5_PLEWA|nr:hypothetical protein NDU88_004649 [Pleurodeles waltl]
MHSVPPGLRVVLPRVVPWGTYMVCSWGTCSAGQGSVSVVVVPWGSLQSVLPGVRAALLVAVSAVPCMPAWATPHLLPGTTPHRGRGFLRCCCTSRAGAASPGSAGRRELPWDGVRGRTPAFPAFCRCHLSLLLMSTLCQPSAPMAVLAKEAGLPHCSKDGEPGARSPLPR